MTEFRKKEILNTPISCVGIEELSVYVENSIANSAKKLITYAHFHTLNKNVISETVRANYSCFDVIHADGIGVYLASHFIYGDEGLKDRITGSDFYPILLQKAITNKWKIFFFGDTDLSLNEIRKKYPTLNIAGMQNGYDYNNEELIKKINFSKPDILVVGIGSFVQEKWIFEYNQTINTKIIIAVGEGIKVFAGSKHRGAKLIRNMGLEWIIRLIYNPALWKRYFPGIPLFCYRVLRQKLASQRYTQ